MSERDCENCKHHTEKGCDSWDCNFERRMARKEIIEMLKVLKEQALESHNDTAIIDVKKDSFIYVMDATINSLKMEQIEPCEDAISRPAVEDAIAETIVNGESLGYAIAQEIVSDLPPVKPQEPKTEKVIKMRDATPEERESIYKYIKSISKPTGVAFWDLEQEPKTGHWEWQTEDIYRCSECGEDIHVKEVLNVPQYEWCPMCGAKMEESEGEHG